VIKLSKIKIMAVGLVCTTLVLGSAGVAAAKQGQDKNPWKNGPPNLKVVMQDQTKAAPVIEQNNRGEREKTEKLKKFDARWKQGEQLSNIFKEGRVLIPVNALTCGLGAAVSLGDGGTVVIEKEGQKVEINLEKGTVLINGTIIDLAGLKNGRITYSPGLVKKLLQLALKETGAAIIAGDLTLAAGQEKEFTISATNPGDGKVYDRARYNFTLPNASLSDITSFQYRDGDTWKDVPLTQAGGSVAGYFGPEQGFPVPAGYNATTTFRIEMAKVGSYTAEIKLVDLDNNNKTIARDTMKITVNASSASIEAEDLSVYVGQEKQFTVSSSNPEDGKAYDRVLFRFSVADAVYSDIASFQYKDGDTWRDLPLTQSGSSLVGYYGPSGGFPLPADYDATTTFRLKITRAGTYNVDLKLVDLDNNQSVIARETMKITVNSGLAHITAPDLAMDSGDLEVFNVRTTNPSESRAYDRVVYSFAMTNASLSDITTFQYKDGDVWRDLTLTQIGSGVTGRFGLSGGFSMPVNYDATTAFRLEMAREGAYSVDIKLLDLNDGERVITQDTMNVTVN